MPLESAFHYNSILPEIFIQIGCFF